MCNRCSQKEIATFLLSRSDLVPILQSEQHAASATFPGILNGLASAASLLEISDLTSRATGKLEVRMPETHANSSVHQRAVTSAVGTSRTKIAQRNCLI
jgi:hypothetical protein